MPLFIEPLGAVDKATAPWWRLILDARLSNEFQDPWGVWYFSVSQLAALLDVCDFMFVEETRITSGALPSGSMKSGKGQFQGIISTMPYNVPVANLGPRAILAASFRSQLA